MSITNAPSKRPTAASFDNARPDRATVLLVLRLYSGFEISAATRNWKPAGAPAIFKLIDAVQHTAAHLRIVFTCKQLSAFTSGICRDQRIELNGLRASVCLLSGESGTPAWLGRFRWHVYELRQAIRIFRYARRLGPRVVYVDRGNLWSAAAIARLTAIPVVYRIMGINPGLKDAFAGNGPRQILTRWLLRSPFSAVVCTQDGSGAELWLDRMLAPQVRRHLLLNGVDVAAAASDPGFAERLAPANRTRVLFVGRLDELKGCDEFLEAFLVARRRCPNALHAIIVGDGGRRLAMQARAREATADADISFAGSLPHGDVQQVYAYADIYISLNRMGNLSNANLEAMRAGCCMIVPQSNAASGIDLTTDAMFPSDTILRVPSVDDVDALANAILRLHAAPEERARRSAKTKAAADKQIGDWASRIQAELRIVDEAAGPMSSASA